MAEKTCIKRLQKEFRALCKETVRNVVARPSPSDILVKCHLFGAYEIRFCAYFSTCNPVLRLREDFA